MESSDVFASLLQNPETMQKLAGIASELMNGMNTASAPSSADPPPSEELSPPALPELPTSDEPSSAPALPELPASDQASSAPALPELPASGEPDPVSELMLRAMPALSVIAQSGRSSSKPERIQLLTALKPFLSPHACSQIDHAEHILSMARMTRTAAEQFIPQLYGRRV